MDLDAAAWAALLLSLRVATVAMLCSLPLALWV
ncbi:MAG TPA: molybdate ABC transporter permease subunit, partial [Sulfitobacter sp.]|nr:molybdate ABC transporter permease subunit [Sulfitobacter sp.]HCQ57589.1 molybdate ABC transporter permease subunit [Sulfitobacter sp.]